MRGVFGRLCLIFMLGLIPALAFGQLTIKGVVTDENGEPLPAANVIIKGTEYGTITDDDGFYILTIPSPDGPVIVETYYIGYRTERQQVDQTSGTVTLNFTLAVDVVQGDEVIVTGTSIATARKQLGNAITTVSDFELRESGARSLDQALSGKIPGAYVQQNSGNPAGGISVRLRGTGTVLGSAEPLYIIDGVIVNNDSPELINLGGYTQNRLVDINPEDIERIEVVKGAAAAALYGSRANNGVIQIFTKRGRQGRPRITYSSKMLVNTLRKRYPVNSYPYDEDGNPVKRYDWQDLIFQTGLGQEHYLSIAGGNVTTNYYVSGAYFNNEGIIKGTQFNRASARVRIDQILSSWANLSVSANYVHSWSDEKPNGGLSSLVGVLTSFIFGPNTLDIRPDPVTGEYPDPWFLTANPLEIIDRYEYTQTIDRFIGSTKLILTPAKGWSIDYVLGVDTYTQNGKAFIPIGATAPAYWRLDNGYSRNATRNVLQLNNDLNIRYQTTIGNFATSTTLVGGTLQYEKTEYSAAESRDLTPVVKIVPGGASQTIGEFRGERVIYGFFAQQTFGLWDRIFATIAGRFDASSVFGENERWQFYPKASLSYLLSEEKFWKESGFNNILPFFKLRASVGESGGLTAIGPYDRFTVYDPVTFNGKSGLVPNTQLGAEDIRPERQREIEFGVDFGIWNNRIGIEFTYYNQKTTDLLLFRNIAPTTGFTKKLENVGTLVNKGVELLIRAIPVDNPKFRWSSTITYAKNSNEASNVPEGILRLPGSWGISAIVDGYPFPVFYGYRYARNPDGSIQLDDNGLPIRDSERGIIGDPNPDWVGSWINEIRLFKNITFRAQFDAVWGQDVFDFSRRVGARYGTGKDYEKELKGEVPPGYFKSIYLIFEHWIEDASFIKLRELSISYKWYPKMLGNIKGIRFSLIGRNLFSWDNYFSWDPETNIGGQRTHVRGFEFVEVPIPRTIQLGMTIEL
ncbi:MAG: TonB-dependent receptor [Calditrichaeota bacterium]|nr:TonB-dependent receptor [Calditrichota bacterium]